MRKRVFLLFLLSILILVSLLIDISCKKIPLYAISDSKILISTNKSFLKTGGDEAIISIIGFDKDGVALHDHTLVLLSTSLGDITPIEIEMMKGRAEVDFISGSSSGVAEIKARSGNVIAEPDPLQIFIGSAALETLSISANPASFEFGGGRSLIRVFAFDKDGNLLPEIPVVLYATSGYFDKGYGVYKTDPMGKIEDYLNVEFSSKVTAESGSKKVEIDITVSDEIKNILPSANFSYSPASPAKNEKIYFNGSLSTDSDGYIVSWEWDFGDGNTLHGEKVSHFFTWTGTGDKTFTVVLKVRDNDGGTGVTSSSITVKE